MAFNTDSDTLLDAPGHGFQNEHAFNSSAISITNAFQVELLNIEEPNELPTLHHFFATALLKDSLFVSALQYLKLCNFFDLNLTIRDIIFPFHSFL
ncbi:hypothetical protein [Mariniflexile ostreae]